ncbi:hypothetical protein [uncultured Bacteroides sp.]|uniref:hypothetical protein n=1 Tax=uncultured Bacteroides sp. TaxID=162156 RepID=UPI002606A0D4|nr:hypothetical protein [uncultured Bacteroides sp.]
MEFKSQIVTTREQSERMLALGIKPETADMVYHYTKSRVKSLEWELQAKPPTLRGKFWTPERIAKLKMPFHKHTDGTAMTGEEVFDSLWGKDVPAWSLTRLLEMTPKFISEYPQRPYCFGLFSDENSWIIDYSDGAGTLHVESEENVFDAIVRMFAWLIKNNHFNTEYLK